MEINRNNYETFFLLYLDRELSAPEMSEVEKFVAENADLQKEFSLLRQTVLVPVQMVFDQKELLFRKEDKRRVIPIYWTRIAAAVAVLIVGSWLITTQLARKQGVGIAGADGQKNIAVKKNSSVQKTNEAASNTSAKSDALTNKTSPAFQPNSAIAKNLTSGNSGAVKNSIKPENGLTGKNNPVQPVITAGPDLRNPSGDVPDEANVAMRKSGVQELQPVAAPGETDPRQISALPGNHSPALLIAAAGTTENVPHVRDENAVFVENEDQTDNAISVVALNDKNKGITRLFKKLTRQTPADENVRKVRLSVFQFSY